MDRRQVLKRAAAAGIVAWTAPAIQTLNMPRALAQVGSPGETCYTVRIESETRCSSPGPTENVASTMKCLYGFDPDVVLTDTTGGCAFAPVTSTDDGNGRWIVTLSNGCSLVAGFSRSGNDCFPAELADGSPAPQGTTGVLYFSGDPISLIELTFCCTPI
jgi:hypothetical protein